MFSEWLEIGSMKQYFKKISSALHPGHECPCYVRKILCFHEWLLEAVFWQPMQDFGCAHINYRRLHEICRVTAQVAVFFSKSVPIPDMKRERDIIAPPPPVLSPQSNTHRYLPPCPLCNNGRLNLDKVDLHQGLSLAR